MKQSATRLRTLSLGLAGLTLTAALAACNTTQTPTEGTGTTDAPADSASGLSGDVLIDGSSTVFPITEAMAEEFQTANPDTRVTVGVSGTGGGFSKFCAGETDISNASRPIKAEEIEACEQAGIEYVEIPVAYDAISVVINPENDWATCLTTEELASIWSPDSQINNWSQVREGFPDSPIDLYGPGTDSGTFDYFTDAINGEEGASRGDYTASEDDNVIVQGVVNDPNAMGYFGLAYYEENADNLNAVAIDDGDPSNGEGCVAPSVATVDDSTYQPLARPIFIYVSAASLDKPQVQAFMDFYTAEENSSLVSEVGYVALNSEIYAKAQERLAARTTGSVFEGGSTVGVRLGEVL
ncbi:PstS family phosphate ABC transporter substrate-binding protein [Picosynechococcus sp. PCC 8807]|uniref:PstS family phosphate ABC transporter substrate-binding protein n=1 Tax=Picosynechococcus sp. PCC 8807 TaxID=195248 RepID=UPI00081082F1|nr:PstS family phosphate ABC transporter substrate-binding protein [Picosynechococcus sp. PCC 8807]ANV91226.1 phosphate-binding protein [Picosynechococcus sp. PCC 8807]